MKKYLLVASLAVMMMTASGVQSENLDNTTPSNSFTQTDDSDSNSSTVDQWIMFSKLRDIINMTGQQLKNKTSKKSLKNSLEQKNNKRLELIKKSIKDLKKKDIAKLVKLGNFGLIFAAWNKNLTEIFEYLLQQININEKDSTGETLLYKACVNKQYDIIQFLLNQKDINVNIESDAYKITPLFKICETAIKTNNKIKPDVKNTIKLLIDKGAKVNEDILKLTEPNPQLFEFINQIIEPNINASSLKPELSKKWTQLKIIIENKSKTPEDSDSSEILLNKVIESINNLTKENIAKIINCNNLFLIFMAIRKNLPNIVQYLLEQEGVEIDKNNEFILLRTACLHENKNIAELLLTKYDIDINTKDNNGSTILHTVCKKGLPEIVNFLLNQEGIDINAEDHDKTTPLHTACQEGHYKIVDLLLNKKGIDINAKDHDKITPLYIACQNGYYEIVNLLLNQKGIDINVKDYDETTPLYIACQNGHYEIVNLLLNQKGIDINVKDHDKTTPLYIACQQGHYEIVNLLLNQEGIDVNVENNNESTPLYVACQEGHHKIVDLLLNKDDTQINKRNKHDLTPLSVACGNSNYETVVRLLKNNNIDVNSQSGFFSPLHTTCLNIFGTRYTIEQFYENKLKIFKLLLSRDDLDVNITLDTNQNTPLHLLCANNFNSTSKTLRKTIEQNKLQLLKCLIQKKEINLNKQNSDKETALQIACRNEFYDIAEFLLQQETINIHITDNKGNTALDYLLSNEHTKNYNEKREKLIKLLQPKEAETKKEIVKKLLKQRQSPSIQKINKPLIKQPSSTSKKKTVINNEQVNSNQSTNETIISFFKNIKNDNLSKIKELLEKNPKLINEINVSDNNYTPLITALIQKKFDIANYLLDQEGINISKQDKSGNSALTYAVKNKNITIIKNILKKTKQPSNLILARNTNDQNSLELAMSEQADFSSSTKKQKTKAHTNQQAIMNLLLEYLSSDQKSNEMCFAIERHLWKLAKSLLNSGANAIKKYNSTPPIILALKTNENQNEKEKSTFIKMLIDTISKTNEYKNNLNAEDKDGYTALSYAVYYQYWDIVNALMGEEVKISFKLLEEIKNQDVLDQITQLGLKPYIETKGELVTNTNDKEEKIIEQREENYKLKFKNSSLKLYNTLNRNGPEKKGIDNILRSLKIDPYEAANESLGNNYKAIQFGDNGFVKLFSAHPESTKKGRVAYIVIEKLKEVWIIEANNEHYKFMTGKQTTLKDLLKGKFVDFDLDKKENYQDGSSVNETNSSENETTLTDATSTEEEMINDTNPNNLFNQSIVNQSYNIAKYLINHNIEIDQYTAFLQNIIDSIKN